MSSEYRRSNPIEFSFSEHQWNLDAKIQVKRPKKDSKAAQSGPTSRRENAKSTKLTRKDLAFQFEELSQLS